MMYNNPAVKERVNYMLLRNSFKFGFELEAFAPMGEFYDSGFEDYECNELNERDGEELREFYDNIERYFYRNYKFSGNCHYDGSVKMYKDGYNSFEWASPVIIFNTQNILKVKKMLMSLKDDDIHINDTCGFHTHFSYDGINGSDAAWILLYISMTPDAYQTFTEFSFKNDGELFDTNIHFYQERYADREYLTKIGNAFVKGDYVALSSILDDSKYRVLRIHPQGTLEWRGPRGFLESYDGIRQYIKALYKVVDIIITALKTKEINGISRDEFNEKLRLHKFEIYNTDYKPEISMRDKNAGCSDILPWFRHYSRGVGNMTQSKMEYIITKILTTPVLINDDKYGQWQGYIINRLNDMNRLRYVITTAYNLTHKLSLNIQYRMLATNITLLPFLNGDIWKFLPYNALQSVISQASFSVESDYKKQTLDFMFNEVIKHYTPQQVFFMIKTLTKNRAWAIRHIVLVHKERLKKLAFSKISHSNEAIQKNFDKIYDNLCSKLNEADNDLVTSYRDFYEFVENPGYVKYNDNMNFHYVDSSDIGSLVSSGNFSNTFGGCSNINTINIGTVTPNMDIRINSSSEPVYGTIADWGSISGTINNTTG